MSKESGYRVKITSKRQATFPKEVLDALHLKPGDTLVIRETPSGYQLQAAPEIPSFTPPLKNKIPESTSAFDLRTFREEGYDQTLRD